MKMDDRGHHIGGGSFSLGRVTECALELTFSKGMGMGVCHLQKFAKLGVTLRWAGTGGAKEQYNYHL